MDQLHPPNLKGFHSAWCEFGTKVKKKAAAFWSVICSWHPHFARSLTRNARSTSYSSSATWPAPELSWSKVWGGFLLVTFFLLVKKTWPLELVKWSPNRQSKGHELNYMWPVYCKMSSEKLCFSLFWPARMGREATPWGTELASPIHLTCSQMLVG